MKHLTAQQKAEELGLDSDFDLFKKMISDSINGGIVEATAIFKSLHSANQKQLLKYCNEYNNDDAYNFFHSLI